MLLGLNSQQVKVDSRPGVGHAGVLVRALGKYLDPAENLDRWGPQNPEHGGTKISTDRPRGMSASDLATCGPVQDCASARHLGQLKWSIIHPQNPT